MHLVSTCREPGCSQAGFQALGTQAKDESPVSCWLETGAKARPEFTSESAGYSEGHTQAKGWGCTTVEQRGGERSIFAEVRSEEVTFVLKSKRRAVVSQVQVWGSRGKNSADRPEGRPQQRPVQRGSAEPGEHCARRWRPRQGPHLAGPDTSGMRRVQV